MALRVTPPGEDPLKGTRALPTPWMGPGNTAPGEDGIARADELENAAQAVAEQSGMDDQWSNYAEPDFDFLAVVRTAEQQAQLYTQQVNRRAWTQSLRAFHNEHYIGSKYTRPEWRNRSRLFVPKTRTAVRKDMASVAASLFNNVEAISCIPGDEGDPRQRASAAVMQELVNYRTDRSSGKASFPWFMVSMGARLDADTTGICVTKQSWKQEFRKVGTESFVQQGEDGMDVQAQRDHYALDVDRPDMRLFPPENIVIHPGADWTNPAQSAAYLILKYPMTVEEIQDMQNAPVNPWNDLSEEILRSAVNAGKQDMEAIRRAREMGLDRFDESQTGTEFQVVWVYENFIRRNGEDWCFFSLGDQHYLTNPRPTREVYPEQFGDRPVAMGYGSLESHRIFPMAPVESWQPLQVETNDLRNLMLDATKQNVMPISKIKRGRRIDLDQVKRRASGSSIFVDDPEDVTWETPPQMGQGPILMSRELSLELDDAAGQQNYGSVENNNALGKTLGGLKLAAGAANAVQEFDIRVWIETWAQPALEQIVRLEQYYESDPVILGIAGQRAQLFEKYGVSQIDDDLMEQQVTVRVSVGLGANDPQQRLAKFETAAQIVGPILEQSPEFQSGQMEINVQAVIEEVFGAAGYKDAGSRFFKDNGVPRPNPVAALKTQEITAKIAKDDRLGKAAMFTGISNLVKAAIGKKQLEADVVDMLLGHQQTAAKTGFDHGHKTNQTHLAAVDHGFRHGMELNEHHRNALNDAHQRQMNERQAAQEAANPDVGEGAELEGAASDSSPQGAPSATEPPAQSSASSPQNSGPQFQYGPDGKISHAIMPNGHQVHFVRGADGKISHAIVPPETQERMLHNDRVGRLESMVEQLLQRLGQK